LKKIKENKNDLYSYIKETNPKFYEYILRMEQTYYNQKFPLIKTKQKQILKDQKIFVEQTIYKPDNRNTFYTNETTINTKVLNNENVESTLMGIIQNFRNKKYHKCFFRAHTFYKYQNESEQTLHKLLKTATIHDLICEHFCKDEYPKEKDIIYFTNVMNKFIKKHEIILYSLTTEKIFDLKSLGLNDIVEDILYNDIITNLKMKIEEPCDQSEKKNETTVLNAL